MRYNTLSDDNEDPEKDLMNEVQKFPHPNNISAFLFKTVSIFVVLIICFILYSSYVNESTKPIITNKSYSSSSPNIIFILADDMSWTSVGYGDEGQVASSLIENLTKLAEGGITMSNYYAQEICTPSRATLLTGRLPVSTGMQYGIVTFSKTWGLPLEETTIAEVLSDNGYATYMLGKWHLGHHTPEYLPTARGFDYFLGFLNGQNYHWTKRWTESPTLGSFTDFMESTTDCYGPYTGSDILDYSTTLYTNKAIDIIESHSSSSNNQPFFLYLAYQAVHDPYDDIGHLDGMPDSYLPSDILATIEKSTDAEIHKEYLKSLYFFDSAVGDIYNSLSDNGLLENTYIIFASDNGGCYMTGGFNGPLRGSKGTLFEGGIKVDSFINSPLLKQTGIVYDKLFHVSDWFPTILSLAGISDYDSSNDKEIDGVDHSTAWYDTSVTARSHLLYNLYEAVDGESFNIWKNGSFAIRNEQYKLMHAYVDSKYGDWWESTDVYDFDDLGTTAQCSQDRVGGQFTYMLYDLVNDPFETTNLYSSNNAEIIAAKEELYNELSNYVGQATIIPISNTESDEALEYWEKLSNNVMPWKLDEISGLSKSYPKYCNSKKHHTRPGPFFTNKMN